MTSEKRAQKDLGSASDWLKQISHAARPIRSTTQIWVVTRRQYGISALVSRTAVISRRNRWWRLEMSAVFSGYGSSRRTVIVNDNI